MKPKIIRTEADYEEALARIDSLLEEDPALGSEQEDELEILSLLVERYEEVHCPVDLPSPLEAIKFRMEQAGLEPKDLVPLIGSESEVSEVLSGTRPLNLPMIRNLVKSLGIPAEVLLQEQAGEGPPVQKERQ